MFFFTIIKDKNVYINKCMDIFLFFRIIEKVNSVFKNENQE